MQNPIPSLLFLYPSPLKKIYKAISYMLLKSIWCPKEAEGALLARIKLYKEAQGPIDVHNFLCSNKKIKH
ncbi:MAG: hypothetical protein PV353_10955 [Bartonella sp.]|nr:hypothetical protein [Bartonella sp.]